MMYSQVLFDGSSSYGHYQVVDGTYSGRLARVLYSEGEDAAQSGVALDDRGDLLFDYNQRFLELLRGLMPKRVLLIGGGALTFPAALQKEMPELRLDVVELDPLMLAIAATYFGFKPSFRTNIYLGDGIDHLRSAAITYDAIIVDVFVGSVVPPVFQTALTARSYRRLLSPKGLVAMNVIGDYYGYRRNSALHRQSAAFRAVFQDVRTFPASECRSLWLPQNFIMIGQSIAREILWMNTRPIQTLYTARV